MDAFEIHVFENIMENGAFALLKYLKILWKVDQMLF